MKVLKVYLWILILSAMAYAGVILAMIKGWGLEPKSWFWIIAGYLIAHLTWPLTMGVRHLLLKAFGRESE